MHKRKEVKGVVVSNKMQKTLVVLATKTVRHPRYGKGIRLKKKYYVHSEGSIINVGDSVTIVETRPLSKMKRWRVVLPQETQREKPRVEMRDDSARE